MRSASAYASLNIASACARACAGRFCAEPVSPFVCAAIRSPDLGAGRRKCGPGEVRVCSGNWIGAKFDASPMFLMILADIIVASSSSKTQQSFVLQLSRNLHQLFL